MLAAPTFFLYFFRNATFFGRKCKCSYRNKVLYRFGGLFRNVCVIDFIKNRVGS